MSSVTQFTTEESLELERKQTIPRLVSVPLAGAAMLSVQFGVGADNPLIATALVLFTASMMFCWTSALHESAHQTLWRSPRLSILSGRLLGTLMFVPYSVYREVHIRHHAYLNRPEDWELWPYSDPGSSLAFRRIFVWFDLFCGLIAGPITYGRMFFHAESPLKSREIRRTIWAEYALIAVAWGMIWGFTTYFQSWPLHLRGILIPMWLAAMLQTGRKLTEHLGMASYDPLLGTRTVLPRQWMIRISSFLNFDIFVHGPHHRHPRVAHNTLETRMEDYMEAHPQVSYPVYSRYWHAVRAMVPSLFRNPGCGVNAGAASESSRCDEVGDFVSDVTRDLPRVIRKAAPRKAGSVST